MAIGDVVAGVVVILPSTNEPGISISVSKPHFIPRTLPYALTVRPYQTYRSTLGRGTTSQWFYMKQSVFTYGYERVETQLDISPIDDGVISAECLYHHFWIWQTIQVGPQYAVIWHGGTSTFFFLSGFFLLFCLNIFSV